MIDNYHTAMIYKKWYLLAFCLFRGHTWVWREKRLGKRWEREGEKRNEKEKEREGKIIQPECEQQKYHMKAWDA